MECGRNRWPLSTPVLRRLYRPAPEPLTPPSGLELEPRHDLPLPWRSESGPERVDVAETGNGRALRIVVIHAGLRQLRIRRSGVVWLNTIEQVGELHAEADTGFFPNPEQPPDGQILHGTPLGAIVIVIGPASKLPGSRVAPRRGIQHEGGGGIEAVAVKVLREQRNARVPILNRALELQRTQGGAGIRD